MDVKTAGIINKAITVNLTNMCAVSLVSLNDNITKIQGIQRFVGTNRDTKQQIFVG